SRDWSSDVCSSDLFRITVMMFGAALLQGSASVMTTLLVGCAFVADTKTRAMMAAAIHVLALRSRDLRRSCFMVGYPPQNDILNSVRGKRVLSSHDDWSADGCPDGPRFLNVDFQS